MTIDKKYIALLGLSPRLCLIHKGLHPLQSDIALSELTDYTALKGRYNIRMGEAHPYNIKIWVQSIAKTDARIIPQNE